jgi:hypothetical protein
MHVVAMQHPRVLSAMAKGLVRHTEMSPLNRKNRVGQLVRFTEWNKQVQEAMAAGSRNPLYSPNFQLQLLTEDTTQW